MISNSQDPPTLKIIERGKGIAFQHRLKEASIISRGNIILNGLNGGDDFEIGPSVDIRCGKIVINTKGFIVSSYPARYKSSVQGPVVSNRVVIEADDYESRFIPKVNVRGELSVNWANAKAYPWAEHVMEPQDKGINDEILHEIYRRFYRIATSLRSHGRGGLARIKDKVEHERILKNDIGRALLNQILDDGIFELKDKFYHWIPDRASALLRVSWDDLRQKRITPELKSYLERFINYLFNGMI